MAEANSCVWDDEKTMGEGWQRRMVMKGMFTHILDTEVCFHAPHTSSAAGNDECSGNTERFEGVESTIEAILSRYTQGSI